MVKQYEGLKKEMEVMSNMNGDLQLRMAELDHCVEELEQLKVKNARQEAEIANLTERLESRGLEKEHYEKWFRTYEAENDKMLEVVPKLASENDLLKQ